MKLRASLAAGILAFVATTVPVAQEQPDPPSESEPRQSGLVEQTRRRLVQLDVSVSGPRDKIAALTQKDFRVSIAGKKIKKFVVDNLCELPEEKTSDTPSPAAIEEQVQVIESPGPPRPPRPHVTYLFYFDQRQMTLAGRQNALDTARGMVEQLIIDGNRGTVVSAGRELRTFIDSSADPKALLAAIDDVQKDRMQWDPTIVFTNEESRREEIVEILNQNDQSRAMNLARQYQREEVWQTDRSLRLLSLVLGRLAEVSPPKAVVYFADTMRQNAGEHYMSFFSGMADESNQMMSAMRMDSFAAGNPFDRVVEEAAAHGIRMYTIQAEGLVGLSPRLSVTQESRAGNTSPALNARNVRDAQNSLAGLALESGGQHFINGVRATKIAKSIVDDLSCLYLLSFDGSKLAENRNLRVSVEVDVPKVDSHTRGRLVLQSEERRRESRLLAAFATPGAVESEVDINGILIPTGFKDGKFTALVQVSVPPSALPTATWDVGISLVSRGKVREDASGRVFVTTPGVRVVFESEMSFAPGPFELITVAHDTTGDALSTKSLEGSWPDPDSAAATLGPIAVIQPESGAFLRETEIRRDGSRGLGTQEILRSDWPAATVGIVCRSKGGKRQITLERRLSGDSAVDFDPLELDLGEDRCAVFSDTIPENTMTTGEFTYQVLVWDGREESATSQRIIFAATPDEHPELAKLDDP